GALVGYGAGTFFAWTGGAGSPRRIQDSREAYKQLVHPVAATSPDADAVAMLTEAGDVVLLDTELHELGRFAGTAENPLWTARRPDGALLALATANSVWILDGKTLEPVRERVITDGGMPAIVWVGDGLMVFRGGFSKNTTQTWIGHVP